VVFLLGLAVFGTGIWLLATEHSKTGGCTNAGGTLSGLSSSCQAIGWAYFAGFVVAGVGLVVLLFTRLMRRHERRYHPRPAGPPELSMHRGTGTAVAPTPPAALTRGVRSRRAGSRGHRATTAP
jgi:hypothetical protein